MKRTYFQNMSFIKRHVLKICSFQKGHPNQKGECPDTLDIPLDPPLNASFDDVQALSKNGSASLVLRATWVLVGIASRLCSC